MTKFSFFIHNCLPLFQELIKPSQENTKAIKVGIVRSQCFLTFRRVFPWVTARPNSGAAKWPQFEPAALSDGFLLPYLRFGSVQPQVPLLATNDAECVAGSQPCKLPLTMADCPLPPSGKLAPLCISSFYSSSYSSSTQSFFYKHFTASPLFPSFNQLSILIVCCHRFSFYNWANLYAVFQRL
jgi:hypothetical protein